MTPEFAEALAKFQAEMPHVGKGQTAKVKTKSGQDYTYDYADLTVITQIALPLLTAHGFVWTAAPTVTEAGFVLRYQLAHIGGDAVGGDYPLPDPSRSSPQEIGSALTYARRYALCAVTGIAPGGEDDDGKAAANARSRDASAPPPAATDLPWFDDIKGRLDKAANATEVEALVAEARKAWTEHRLSKRDADEWASLVANRKTELGVLVS